MTFPRQHKGPGSTPSVHRRATEDLARFEAICRAVKRRLTARGPLPTADLKEVTDPNKGRSMDILRDMESRGLLCALRVKLRRGNARRWWCLPGQLPCAESWLAPQGVVSWSRHYYEGGCGVKAREEYATMPLGHALKAWLGQERCAVSNARILREVELWGARVNKRDLQGVLGSLEGVREVRSGWWTVRGGVVNANQRKSRAEPVIRSEVK